MQFPIVLVQFAVSVVGFVLHGMLFGAGFAVGALLGERLLERLSKK